VELGMSPELGMAPELGTKPLLKTLDHETEVQLLLKQDRQIVGDQLLLLKQDRQSVGDQLLLKIQDRQSAGVQPLKIQDRESVGHHSPPGNMVLDRIRPMVTLTFQNFYDKSHYNYFFHLSLFI
jgi:hypothetical protein